MHVDTVGMLAYMTIDDNAQQNSDVKKKKASNEREIHDSPSSALQIIILIINITIGMI